MVTKADPWVNDEQLRTRLNEVGADHEEWGAYLTRDGADHDTAMFLYCVRDVRDAIVAEQEARRIPNQLSLTFAGEIEGTIEGVMVEAVIGTNRFISSWREIRDCVDDRELAGFPLACSIRDALLRTHSELVEACGIL